MRIKVLAFLRLQKQRFYDQTEYKRSANKQSTSAYASPQIYPPELRMQSTLNMK